MNWNHPGRRERSNLFAISEVMRRLQAQWRRPDRQQPG